MQFWRCKCGKQTIHESGCSPAPCEGCPDCGTTFAQYPSDHKTPERHDPAEEWVIRKGEPTKILRCQRCHKEVE